MGTKSKELHKHYRAMIASIGFTDSLKTADESIFQAFMELFKGHHLYPAKLAHTVDIKIVPNLLLPQCYELNLVKVKEGQQYIESISYRSCCIPVSSNPRDTLKRAMRNHIVPQLKAYRCRTKHVCTLCGSCQQIEVDHAVKFCTLFYDFLLERTDAPHKFSKNAYNSVCFTDADATFARDWSSYHAKHSVLRMLCRACNLSTSYSTSSATQPGPSNQA